MIAVRQSQSFSRTEGQRYQDLPSLHVLLHRDRSPIAEADRITNQEHDLDDCSETQKGRQSFQEATG